MLLMGRERRATVRVANGNTLGEQLRVLRKQSGMTQGELGKRIGVSIRSICSYERDECEPPVQTLLDLAAALRIGLDDLLSGAERPNDGNDAAPQRRWLRKLDQIQRLPERKQQAVLQVLDMALKS